MSFCNSGGNMPKPTFVGRKLELERLKKLLNKKTASFIVVKGRRRVGKSRLIEEFSKQFDHYYKFEGLAPDDNVTQEDQLNEFARQISRNFHVPNITYADWSDALWMVGDQVKKGRTLLFFDEISWMAHDNPTFLGKIKTFWDNQLNKNHQLVFVACSSVSHWIDHNLLSSTGFVGRISFTLVLNELPLVDCNKFWQENISAYEKFKVLSVTGGIPKYLEEIDPQLSAEENIKQLCFTKGGLLVAEYKRIFSDLFKRKSKFYEAVVDVLATGAKEQSIIQKLIGREGEHYYGRIAEYLSELDEAGFIRRDYTWNISTGEDSKLSKYRLSDNYLRFYLKYIIKNLDRIKRDAFIFKSLILLPEWNSIMGLQFENLILNNRASIHTLLNISSDEIINENPFFQTQTNRHAGCQIDYLIQTKFNSLYVCEVKFSKDQVDKSIINEVQNKINVLQYASRFSCRPVLIHVNGVSDSVIDSEYFAKIINMGDLLYT